MDVNTLAIGKMMNSIDMVFIIGQKEINMKGNGSKVKSMDMVNKLLLMVDPMMANERKIKNTVKEHIYGLMEKSI